MKKRKILYLITIIICLIIIAILIIFKLKQNSEIEVEETEITPLEEVTEEEERQTIISLYYTNKETNTLMPEARIIDAKELLEEPYKTLIELIIAEPKNEKLESSIPEGTTVNSTNLVGDMLEIDLSKEFIQNQDGDSEKIYRSIYAIVDTLTELNEISSVKISVDGDVNANFESANISLSNAFERLD